MNFRQSLTNIKCIIVIFYSISALIYVTGCKKYLDAKTDKKLVVPSTLQDAQALLDNYKQLNLVYPSAGQESDDDHYFLPGKYNALSVTAQQLYTWDVNAQNYNDWLYLYENVLYANLALETTSSIQPDAANISTWNFVKGQALFFRAFAFWHIAEYFATPYNSSTASVQPGIPLRLTSDVNENITRGSLQETYQQITGDLIIAATLLPPLTVPESRPSKAAAFGLLARIYLTMNQFKNAGLYADSCLQLHAALMDYNVLDTNAAAPIESFNPEVIFQSSTFFSPTAKTDTVLYNSYQQNDLRRSVFFSKNTDGTHSFKGSYNGSYYYDIPFNGIAVDEMYLIRAEYFARVGELDKSLNDVNTLLKERWLKNKFIPLAANNIDAALEIVLRERRKELTGRNSRWFDIRRINEEGKYAIGLTRIENGQIYTLQPNDVRYTFLIPPQTISTYGLMQNNRK